MSRINALMPPEQLAAHLRDVHAGRRTDLAKAAMVAILGNHELLLRINDEFPDHATQHAVAKYAYAIADAMLAAHAEEP